ncbi:hypothetical protein TrVE_jg12672 [Triparma verrucosa]|uniref:Uncharacterized protein n=1 Tax=Triparma verrucosa TaxID=1606542 RepID=A0A9W7C2K2_9STRA|nr:hypothetical protein TrVE_jg12672 [Triparma verrucosa]
MSIIVDASTVISSSFHSANQELMRWYSLGVRWVSTFIVYAANRFSAAQLVAFLGVLFALLYLLNRDSRDENDRLMDDIGRDLEEIAREIDAINDTKREEEEEEEEEEEQSPPRETGAGLRRRRKKKKKKQNSTTAPVAALLCILVLLAPANSFAPALPKRSKVSLKRPPELQALPALTVEDVTNAFFPLSLPPYLLFLREAALPVCTAESGPENGSSPVSVFPPTVVAAFRFLLVFVFLSIPSAILSMALLSGHSLASCDFLHGSAESLLAVTNLLVVLSLTTMTGKLLPAQVQVQDSEDEGEVLWWKGGYGRTQWTIAALAVAAFFVSAAVPFLSFYPELPPLHTSYLTATESASNLLSPQTWLVHTSSLLEWLYSMALIYSLSPTVNTGNEANTKLHAPIVYAMVTLHTSGVAACVYHLFGNSFDWIVALQGGLTFFGNCGLYLATKQVRERIENGYDVVEEGGDWGSTKGGEIAKTVGGSVAAALAALFLSDQLSDSGQVGEIAAGTLIVGAAGANYKKWRDRETVL